MNSHLPSTDEPTIPEDRGNVAIRLAQLDMTRATEQASIILALLMGRGQEKGHRETRRKKAGDQSGEHAAGTAAAGVATGKDQQDTGAKKPAKLRKQTFEEQAKRSIRGYLQETYCKGTVTLPGEKHPVPFGSASDKAWDDAWKLECITQAVDGVSDLQAGHWGSSSVIAGGPEGWMISNKELQLHKQYLVLATPSGPLKETLMKARDEVGQAPKDLVTTVELLLKSIMGGSRKHPLEVTIGAQFVRGSSKELHETDFIKLHGRISSFSRLMTLTGSPISGAVAACLPNYGMDIYAGAVSRNQAILMAIVAYAMDGGFLALPFTPDRPTVGSNAYFSIKSFVKPECDVFLVATGITKHPVLEGVEFRENNVVSTQTMVLRAHTQSTRFISHHHRLHKKSFHLWERGKPRSLTYKELQGYIGKIVS